MIQKEKIEIKVNKSKIYFTPLFNQLVPISHFKLLKNTYFWCDDFQEEIFCLLYKFDGRVEGSLGSRSGFTVYEKRHLFGSNHFEAFRDFGEYVLYVFNLTAELVDYRNLLIEGAYSKLPQPAKDLIVQFNLRMWGPNDANFIQQILYKDERLREIKAEELGYPMRVGGKIIQFPKNAELASALNPDNEMFANFLEIEELER